MRDNISFNHNFEFITALLAAYKRHYNDESLDFVECSNTKYVNDFIALIGDKYKTIMEYLKAGYTNDCGDISYLSMSLNEDFSINKEMVDKYQINEKLSCGNINDLSKSNSLI